MLTKKGTVRGLVGTAVDLSAIQLCQRLFIGFQILLLFGDVILKVSEDRLVVSFSFGAGFANCTM